VKALKHAAESAFSAVYASQGSGLGHVERVSVDVELDGQREIVSLRLSSGRLAWSCTCGELECRHAQTALAFLTDAEAEAPGSLDRITTLYEPASRISSTPPRPDVRTAGGSDQAERADTDALRAILDDLLSAVVRSGVSSGVSASVEEALERMVAAAPSPMPLGIARFVGRLKEALGAADVRATARLLQGAARVIDDLGIASEQRATESRRRIVSWLGALARDENAIDRVQDRSLLEVARECVSGVERVGIERRYLVDLDSGEVVREERALGAITASHGPCPRLVEVSLATLERGAEPRRARLLQYIPSVAIEPVRLQRVADLAAHRFAPLVERFVSAVSSFPGLSEPFALVAPKALSGESQPLLLDDLDQPLPIVGDAANARYLREVSESGQLLWVAGRLDDPGGVLAMLPLAAAVRRDGHLHYTQL